MLHFFPAAAAKLAIILIGSCELSSDPATPTTLSTNCSLQQLQSSAASPALPPTAPPVPPPVLPASPPPALGLTQENPAPSCQGVSTAGVTWVTGLWPVATQVYCDGAGWALLAANRMGGTASSTQAGLTLDWDSGFWNGEYAGTETFELSGGDVAIDVAFAANAIRALPFTKMRFATGTESSGYAFVVLWGSASTFAEKKVNSLKPAGASQPSGVKLPDMDNSAAAWGWRQTYNNGGYTSQRCLFCYVKPGSYNDAVVEGLAVRAEATGRGGYGCDAHSYCSDKSAPAPRPTGSCVWCSGVTNDCGTDFPVASIGHRGGGNQYCSRAVWIQ